MLLTLQCRPRYSVRTYNSAHASVQAWILLRVQQIHCVRNAMAHAQKPDFVFRRNGRVHLNRRGASVRSTTGRRAVHISLQGLYCSCKPVFCSHVTRKADSHIACRAHAVPLPCRAAKGLECVFPIWITQRGRVWFTLAMPHPCHALAMPFFSRPRHSTAVERRPVGYLPAFGFFRQPRGVPRRLLSEA